MSVNEPSAPRYYGLRVGLMAGAFSIGQALLLYAAALGGYEAISSIQQGINIDTAIGQPAVDFTLLAGPLLPALIISYGSMLVAGGITLWLARSAGRMAAMRAGRHEGGARAGMWVWLISSLIWLAASVVVVLLFHRDGTLSGVLFGSGQPDSTGAEIAGLLTQEVIAALIALGFAALAGSRGANGATLVEPAPMMMPVGMGPYPFAGYPPAPWRVAPPQGYPPAPQAMAGAPRMAPPLAGAPGYPGAMYPGAAYPPPMAWAPPTAVYPPPPSHYLPQQPAAPAPQATPPSAPAPNLSDAPAAGASPQEPGA